MNTEEGSGRQKSRRGRCHSRHYFDEPDIIFVFAIPLSVFIRILNNEDCFLVEGVSVPIKKRMMNPIVSFF